MHTTPVSLLHRLRDPGAQDAWTRFVQLYTPLLYSWAHRVGLSGPDADDLVQDVFTLLVRKLPEFNYHPGKSFRAWLRTVTLHRWQELQRRPVVQAVGLEQAAPDALAAPDGIAAFWESEYRQHLVNRVLHLVQTDFTPTTWKAFWEFVAANRPAAEVAAELGLSVKAVYLAKARVLRRLREELTGLLD